jgi:hypothetical protein
VLAAATAQVHITTSHVRVLITGTGQHCPELHDVSIVMDDDDNHWFGLDNVGKCLWTRDLGERNSFSTKFSHFSLRVDSGRTDCRQAGANEKELVAEFEFTCCKDDTARNLHVKTVPPMPVSYLRDVPQTRGEPTLRCVERGSFPEGDGRIGNTQFHGEKIYLQLGRAKPMPGINGLPLNDIVLDGRTVLLTRDGVVYRLFVQRAKGKAGSAPTLSSTAISIDVKKLTELKLESAEFDVVK